MKTTLKLSAVAVMVLLSGCNQNDEPTPGDVSLRLMETSDIHSNLLGFDYYQNRVDRKLGLSRTAVLIHQARQESPNHLLIDNGDLIQGSPLADFIHEQQLSQQWLSKQAHPAIKALNALNYDVGNLGNHEFNFGLDFLSATLQGANFPYVNANVFQPDAFDEQGAIDWRKQKFTPYVLLDRQVKDSNGRTQTIKVGVLGLTPPQISDWDKLNLQGKVVVADMVDTAQHYVPEMKAKGADIVVVVAHTGIIGGERQAMMENAALPLAKVAGVNALLLGHAHRTFPGDYPNIDGVDNDKGTLAGVPTVMPGVWGNHLGIVDLKLSWRDGRWQVVSSQSQLRAIDSSETSVEDPVVVDQVIADHEQANQWLDEALSKITQPIHSFFALVQDDTSIQIVSDAQLRHARKLQQDGVLKEAWPILSAAAPFRGGRNGPADFTYVAAGDISLRNVADLYVFPNTLQVVAVNGATVREWLERSAVQFNQIDPTNSATQWLVNERYRTFNFDVIDGVNYQIDVTQPARYNLEGNKVSDSYRITNLTYQGQPIDPAQMFYVVTNNYRASGGGNFPGVNAQAIVHEDQFETREVLADYLKELAANNPGGFAPPVNDNWRLADLPSNLDLRFYTSPLEEAKAVVGQRARYLSTQPASESKYPGFAVYQLTLAP
ncbi:bifunctional 2',3'-cyclic-nucleotide 2'-phosphodiesterase/3'-nucleotidase [Aeromonas cavernicola]|uniref:Bifunctional 2',3'-cyclic-nucleotide 2'-phosphodiesterase/3'-nucleotidase n=1 Tax=Aeromonas cavernicola TaxID=1006623 RepID=A0A2H9U9L6_9GAMM|nr:bifunctional 2',3'-cyclic-nucleotide 2'-phosphodiesterase/3'-nucleotidase [Aeromonas cavernicola]PJG60712.1 bifunctional 2',3'-cyclic-nucleotide 2'-phosphodiesterase/3'-nucleotidase [Aeromonas cavernicola]